MAEAVYGNSRGKVVEVEEKTIGQRDSACFKEVADAVAIWRLRQKWKKEDATVGKAKVAEDLAVWVEQQWKCEQLTQGEQLSYGLWIIDVMMSQGFPSAWAGMAA